VETVANVMRRPYYMDAPKAKEFGVIDRVSLGTVIF
jgi:ATP-dependent protease ClpP protease subunit